MSEIDKVYVARPNWFKLPPSPAIRFVLLSYWSFVKGAVVYRAWEWEVDEIEGRLGPQENDSTMLDISQHLMRSEISNSFFCHPIDFKKVLDNEVKVFPRREINLSRKIITLNFIFSLPSVFLHLGKDKNEFVVFSLTFALKLFDEVKLEETFLYNQNTFICYTKQVIDKFSKTVTKFDNKPDAQDILKMLGEDVRRIMEDIESILCPQHFDTRLKFFKDFSFNKLIQQYESGESGSEKRNETMKFLKQVLFNHFRSACNTIIVGSNPNYVNNFVAFLECYLLEHEQECERYCLSPNQKRMCPFLPIQGICRSDPSKSFEEVFERTISEEGSPRSPNAELIFFNRLPVTAVDIDAKSCYSLCSIEKWSQVRDKFKKHFIERKPPKKNTKLPLPDFPFEKATEVHPWISDHIERLVHIPAKFQRHYMKEFRNLMLRKVLLVKKLITEWRHNKIAVDITVLKKLWWMNPSNVQTSQEQQNKSEKTNDLDAQLIVGWVEHVCPNLGLYALITQPGTANHEIENLT